MAISLFTTKRRRIPDTWFSDTHKLIQSATDLKELLGYLGAIQDDYSIYNSAYETAKLMMLEAYCSLRIQLIEKQLNKGNRNGRNNNHNHARYFMGR